MDADMHAAVTEAVADVVAVTRPPDYLPVQDMRYAIQALTAFPGSEALFTLPSTDDPLVHY